MKTNKCKLLIFLFATMVLSVAVFLVGCGGSADFQIGVCPTEVEYGKFFYAPDLYNDKGEVIRRRDYNLSLILPSGEEIKDFASEYPTGMICLKEEGKHTFKYTYNGKSENIVINCIADKTAPYLYNELSIANKYYTGSYFELIGGDVDDPSGCNGSVCNDITFWVNENKPDLETIKADLNQETHRFDDTVKYKNVTADFDLYDDEEKLLIKYVGRYIIVLPAEDEKGNKTDYIYYFDAEELYYDKDLCEKEQDSIRITYKENITTLMSFNENGYLQYVSSLSGWGDATEKLKIVEKDDCKCLSAMPSGRMSSYYLTQIKFFEPIDVSSAKFIYMRYRVDQTKGIGADGTDYSKTPPQLYFVPYSYNPPIADEDIENNELNCADGVWQVAQIPYEKLIIENETSIKGIKLCVAGDLYIDEIWFATEEFVDNNRDAGVLCDFDEEGYVYKVQKASIGCSAAIDIIDKDALYNDYGVDNTGVDGSVLMIKSLNVIERTAVMDINLFENVKSEKDRYICFRVYYYGKVIDDDGAAMFGKLIFERAGLTGHDEIYDDNGNLVWTNHKEVIRYTNYHLNSKRWIDFEIPTSVFADEGDEFSAVEILVEGTVYIDKIWVK